MPKEPYYHCHDTHIRAWLFDKVGNRDRFYSLMDRLASAGYTVQKCPRIEKDYACLSDENRYITHPTPSGLFECNARWFPAGMELESYQNVVKENIHGGRYDFQKFDKMPFLIRMRFVHFRNTVESFLAENGYCHVTRDKVPITQGMRAYGLCERSHRWVAGRLYGGINGMWHLYSDAHEFLLNHSGGYYLAHPPAELKGRQFSDDKRNLRRKAAFQSALIAKNYRRVAAMAEAAAKYGYDLDV